MIKKREKALNITTFAVSESRINKTEYTGPHPQKSPHHSEEEEEENEDEDEYASYSEEYDAEFDWYNQDMDPNTHFVMANNMR